jgi:ketosteroid isomerase-like protein
MNRHVQNFFSIVLAIALVGSIAEIVTFSQSHDRTREATLNELVQTERAFARTSVEKGVRESFMQYFAEDGINFQPYPTRTRQALLKQPAQTGKPSTILNWEPIYADVSRSGDLGYTTGPYTLSENSANPKAPQHGVFFSIWKKQLDGTWKVMLDSGVQTGTLVLSQSFQAAPASTFRDAKAKNEGVNLNKVLIDLDTRYGKQSDKQNAGIVYAKFIANDVRLHRDGIMPLIGHKEVIKFIDGKHMTWTPLFSDAARAGDLGYTYGTYELKAPSGMIQEKGYYVRVWKRQADGDWKAVVDTTSPLPPGK